MFATGIAFVVFLVVTFSREIDRAARLPWGALGVASLGACLLSLTNYGLRWLRWQWFLARLDQQAPWRASLLCYFAGFAFTLLPGKAGELMRARYYLRFGVGAEAVSAGFIVERMLDFAAITALCGLGAQALADTLWLRVVLIAGMLISIAVVIAAPFAFWQWARRQQPPPRATAAPSQNLRRRIQSFALAGLLHARTLMQPAPVAAGLGIGLVAWALEGIGFWWLAHAASPGLVGVAEGTGIYALGMLVGALSFIPGGVGGTEAVMGFGLAHAGFDTAYALAVTLACRLATLWLAVALGWLAVARLWHLQRRLHAA